MPIYAPLKHRECGLRASPLGEVGSCTCSPVNLLFAMIWCRAEQRMVCSCFVIILRRLEHRLFVIRICDCFSGALRVQNLRAKYMF